MFYYYGAKNLLSRYYPVPKHKLIIEPFAGSAAYSTFHLSKDKTLKTYLIEKDKIVYDLWKFLLSANREDIQNYKTPEIGEYTNDFFIMTCAVSNAVSKCKRLKFTPRISRVFEIQKRKILKLLDIRDRIEIHNVDFSEISNLEATWFIDPPYQTLNCNENTIFANGNGYSSYCNASCLNFIQLGEWCKTRRGQVIVCEKQGATWLPFVLLKRNKTSLNKCYNEVIWTNT